MNNNEFNEVNRVNKNILKHFQGYFNSIMSKIGFKKVNWTDIIIMEFFQDYFNFKELKHLSMLSKFTREKLKPVLFKSIQLLESMECAKYYTREYDGFYRIFNVKSFEKLSMIDFLDKEESEKIADIKISINNINYEIQDIKNFVNNIFIKDLRILGQHLYSVYPNFVNLLVLKIHSTPFQYSIFQKLGEYFPKLETFELNRVTLTKESTASNDLNEIIFPSNLNYLSISYVEVIDITTLAQYYRAVFNGDIINSEFEYAIPNICLPSLKKLQFNQLFAEDNGLGEFLQTNPNLEQLSVDNFSPGISRYFNYIKCLQVDQLEKVNNFENLISNQNIKTLTIIIEKNGYYDRFEKVCLMCPSVEFLHFSIVCSFIMLEVINYYITPEEAINIYLTPILKKLPNLKTIELPIYTEALLSINTNDLPQIEKMIFVMDYMCDSNIHFDKHPTLKEVEFRFKSLKITKKEFLEKYKNYKDWKFEFIGRTCKGYKISNKY